MYEFCFVFVIDLVNVFGSFKCKVDYGERPKLLILNLLLDFIRSLIELF